jgi:xanthine dehydrogenase small subunit
MMKDRNGEEPGVFVSRKKILPDYFSEIKVKLQSLQNARLTTHDPITIGSRLTTQLVGGGTDLYVQKHEEMVQSDIQFVF